MNAHLRQSDVLIIGAGVIGLSSAYQLLKAGRQVTVLDARGPGAGSSHGNCGTLTPSHAPPLAEPAALRRALAWMGRSDAPLYIRPRMDPALWHWLIRFALRCRGAAVEQATTARAVLLKQSAELLQQLIADTGMQCEYRAEGLLYVFREQRVFDEYADLPERMGRLGLGATLLDGAAVRALEPALNDSVIGGLRHENDAQLRPDRYVAELARLVREAGGVVVEDASVSGFERRADQVQAVVSADGRRFAARQVVAAVGAWSPPLLKGLDLQVPIQPGKGYSITYSRPQRAPRLPLVLKERSVCVTTWDSGYRLGSTMEFSGYDDSLNPRRLAALERAAREYLLDPVGESVVERWQGWRPMVFDDLPLIGLAPGYANLWLATGHGMLGVSMSAATGALLRQLMLDQSTDIDPTPFRPARVVTRCD